MESKCFSRRWSQLPTTLQILLCVASAAQYLATSAVSFVVLIVLQASPVELTHFWMYMSWAAWASPVIGWLSDRFVVARERRRPMAVLGVTINIVIFALFAASPQVTQNYVGLVILSLVQTIAQLAVNVPVNGIIVELGGAASADESKNRETMAEMQSDAMTCRLTGSLVSSVAQSALLLVVSPRELFIIGAALYGIAGIMLLCLTRCGIGAEGVSDLIHKKPAIVLKGCREAFFDLRARLRCGVACARFVGVLVFVLVYCSVLDARTVVWSFLYHRFHFPTWLLSLTLATGLLGSVAGAQLFRRWVRGGGRPAEATPRDDATTAATAAPLLRPRSPPSWRSTPTFLFGVGSVMGALSMVTTMGLVTGFVEDVLHVPAGVYAPIDAFFVSLCTQFAFMPVLAVAAERCPVGYEAAAFELFEVVSLGGSSVSAILTAAAAKALNITNNNYSNLWVLLVACAGTKALPIFAAMTLPSGNASRDDPDASVNDSANEAVHAE